MSQIPNSGFKSTLSPEGDDPDTRPSVVPAFLKGFHSDGITVKCEIKGKCSDCNGSAYWFFKGFNMKWRKCGHCLGEKESDLIIHTYFTLGELSTGVN